MIFRLVLVLMVLLFLTAYSSTLEGNSKEMSTSELSGGARIHYIFQSVFVKSLEVCFYIFPIFP